MLKGLLIYNKALSSIKYQAIYDMYLNSANKLSINLQLMDNTKVLAIINDNNKEITNKLDCDFILYLDKDIILANQLEDLGYRLYNKAKAIEICDHKYLTFLKLSNQDINMPLTILAPKLYPKYQERDLDVINVIEDNLNYPIVIKEAFGSFGSGVYLVNNQEELIAKRNELLAIPHIYQEFIKSSYKVDYRIQVVNHQVVASVKRESKDDFRANVSNGGKMTNVILDKKYHDLAIKVSKILDLDFAGIDVLIGENNTPILCEVNSNAHIKNLYDATNIDVSYLILKYIIEDKCFE